MAALSHNPYPRSPNPSTRSYDSSSVSSATSPQPPGQFSTGLMNTSTRASAGPTPQPIGIPPPLASVHQPAFQPYTPVTAGSGMGRESLASNDSAMSTPGLSAAQSSGAQKRAYRQRRKDPSCDACRERKVKCDATEMTSCSECASRNVKCQFTKETNRRMSSIKQVQDLEKQIERVRKENSGLRRMLSDSDGRPDVDVEGVDNIPLHLPEIGSEPKRRKRSTALLEQPTTRTNLRKYAKGIWKPPPPFRQPSTSSSASATRPELPSRPATEQLLHSYYASFHTMFPILHWPTFQQAVEDLYSPANSQSVSPSSIATFFAVLSLGSLFSPEPHLHRSYRAAELLEAARRMVDPWNDEFGLEDARTAILIAMALYEMNLRSAAWRYLGSAVRVAQDIGLHSESGPWPFVEGEMRRRVWWTIYIADRVMAVELGRPFSIDDTDCDVSLPAGVDDHHIHEAGLRVPHGAEALTHSLLAIIHVVRSYTALGKALLSPVIAPTRLATFDQHFGACMRSFPPICDPNSNIPLLPHLLNPLIYLLNARLLLHRHNLSPNAPVEVRLSAIEQCTHTAAETAALIARTPPSLADSATALLVTHVFRSVLFLLFLGYVEPATVLVRALASINSRRDVAVPCGRFLAFFISTLTAKRAEYSSVLARGSPALGLQSFHPPHRPSPNALQDMLLRDEELLAYISGDLQAAPEAAWVWTGGEKDITGSNRARPSSAGAGANSGTLYNAERRTGLTEEESRDWGGWERLEGLVHGLASRQPPPSPQAWGRSLPPLAAKAEPNSGPGLPPMAGPSRVPVTHGGAEGSVRGSLVSGPKSKSQDRISIANII